MTCTTDTMLNEAARIMWEADCGFVPVVDQTGGRLAGVITDRDVCMAAFFQGKPLTEIPVLTALSTTIASCREEDDLGKVHEVMRLHRVRRVPVVEGRDRLIGVVSLNDVALRGAEERGRGSARELAETLREVCRPHVEARA